jgi:hypothetical protein
LEVNAVTIASRSWGELASEDVDPRAAADELASEGIVVVRNLLPRATVDRWARAFRKLFAQRMARPGALAERGPRRYYTTLPWTAPFADPAVFAHPFITDVIRHTLGPHYSMVQLAADTPLSGSIDQPVHRDCSPLFSDDFPTPLYAVAVNFPLVDVTEENGPFAVARGTHVLPRDEADDAVASGSIPLERLLLARGDVMIRTPLALHCGTANRTSEPRPMVVMGFVRSWLSTPELSMEIPRSRYRRFSAEVRGMLRCTVVDALEEHDETYLDFQR